MLQFGGSPQVKYSQGKQTFATIFTELLRMTSIITTFYLVRLSVAKSQTVAVWPLDFVFVCLPGTTHCLAVR
jgi:hypothetical protein